MFLPSMSTLERVYKHEDKQKACIVFVHGFTGSGQGTWRDLAPRIADDERLKDWDCWLLSYATSWLPDVRGFWKADPDIPLLTLRLATDLKHATLADYNKLVLIAHSMGGLIVQRVICDHPDIAKRVTDVIFFGTPSGGLAKAGWLNFWKAQLDNMSKKGTFIKQLRENWQSHFEKGAPFNLLAVAGSEDEFVPSDSSLKPFPKGQQAAVPGNHVSMIHPPLTNRTVPDLIVNCILRKGASMHDEDAARVAIEQGEFQSVIDRFLPQAETLDPRARVQLAIALDAIGRRDEAYQVLSMDGEASTDVIGMLAGRHKRRWIETRDRNEAEAARTHYEKGFTRAKAESNLPQARYHGINLAFLLLAFRDDRKKARDLAREVLKICEECRKVGEVDSWIDATEAEAHLILGEENETLTSYRRFVSAGHKPWQMASTLQNALMIAETLERPSLVDRLHATFSVSSEETPD